MIHIYGEPHPVRGHTSPTKPFNASILQTYDIVVFCAQQEEDLDQIQKNIHAIPPELGIIILIASAEPGRDKLNLLLEAFAHEHHYPFFNPYLGRSEKFSDHHFYISVVMFVQERNLTSFSFHAKEFL